MLWIKKDIMQTAFDTLQIYERQSADSITVIDLRFAPLSTMFQSYHSDSNSLVSPVLG